MSDLIDQDHLNRYVGDDSGLLSEILTIYEEQLEHWIGCMTVSMSDEDWYLACHTLKGASRGVGVWSIGDLAEGGEKLVGVLESKDDGRQAVLLELSNLASQVIKEVTTLCEGVAA